MSAAPLQLRRPQALPISDPAVLRGHIAAKLRELVATWLGLSDAEAIDHRTWDHPATRMRIRLVSVGALSNDVTAETVLAGILGQEVAQRDVATVYLVGGYRVDREELVVRGWLTLGDVVRAVAGQQPKRPPMRPEDRPRVPWPSLYPIRLSALRPLDTLARLLHTLGSDPLSAETPQRRMTRPHCHGVPLETIYTRQFTHDELTFAATLSEAREAEKRASPETLHATRASDYGSHMQGVLSELILQDWGLGVDTEIRSKGDGGVDAVVPHLGLSIDAKANAQRWRQGEAADLRVKQEHIQWGVAADCYCYVALDSHANCGEALGWVFLDEIVRHAPARRLRNDPKYPINYLLPLQHLRPISTLRALIAAEIERPEESLAADLRVDVETTGA